MYDNYSHLPILYEFLHSFQSFLTIPKVKYYILLNYSLLSLMLIKLIDIYITNLSTFSLNIILIFLQFHQQFIENVLNSHLFFIYPHIFHLIVFLIYLIDFTSQYLYNLEMVLQATEQIKFSFDINILNHFVFVIRMVPYSIVQDISSATSSLYESNTPSQNLFFKKDLLIPSKIYLFIRI